MGDGIRKKGGAGERRGRGNWDKKERERERELSPDLYTNYIWTVYKEIASKLCAGKKQKISMNVQ